MREKVEVLWLSQQDVIAAGGLDMAAAMDDDSFLSAKI